MGRRQCAAGEGNLFGSRRQYCGGEHNGFSVATNARFLLQSPSDVTVLAFPSWWTAAHALRVLAGAFTITIAVLCWVVVLKQRVNRQAKEAESLKQAAESASRAKSEFVANMSHEIRTPMNGVLGMTALALESELSADQRDLIETARFSAEALLTIVNDVLDFSKIEAGKMDLDPQPMELEDGLARVIKPAAFKAEQKGLELICDVAPDVPRQIVADVTRLSQVLTNLLGNAIKFTEKGQVQLRVAFAQGEHSLSANGSLLLQFSVQDSGIGIPADRLDSVFGAFTQADASTTRKYGETGLGLTISAKLVQLMGGRIWVESQPNVGSCFHFTIDAAASGEEVIGRSLDLEAFSGTRILIVDDNWTMGQTLLNMAAALRLRPSAVTNGEQALQALRNAASESDPFALAVIDCHMPGEQDFDLPLRIQQESGLAGTRMAVLTSRAEKEDGRRCRELGIATHFSKPVLPGIFAEAIRSALSGNAVAPVHGRDEANGTKPNAIPPLRILLAEDNPVNQKLAFRLLEKMGHTVTLAPNGLEACRVAGESVRSYSDGRADARNGRHAGHPTDSGEGAVDRWTHSDYCAHGSRHRRRSGKLPRRGYGCPRLKADSAGGLKLQIALLWVQRKTGDVPV